MPKNEQTKNPGRPLKGAGRRIQTTIYSDISMLAVIDSLVNAKEYESRSEFYHQAAQLLLKVRAGGEPELQEAPTKKIDIPVPKGGIFGDPDR